MSDISGVMKRLESSDPEERIDAVRQIPQFSAASMPAFIIGLGDSDWRVRRAAVDAFARLDQPESFIADLIVLLHHPDNVGLRNAAIEILIGLGPLAVAKLCKEICCADVEVRKFVIDILGEIGDPSCANELIEALADADINVRYAAAETLGKLRITRAIEPLLSLMCDPDPGLKFTILHSLALIGGEIPTERLFVHLKDRLLRKALFDCFAKVGGCEVVPYLIAGLSDPLRQVREAAMIALFELQVPVHCSIETELAKGKVDADLIAAELEKLFSGDRPYLKEAALSLYSAVGAHRDLAPLLSCVLDENLSSLALKVFAAFGEAAYGRLLVNLENPDPQQFVALIYVASELGFAQGLPFAFDGARAADPQLRQAAARAMGQLGGAEALILLLRLFEDEIAEVQDAAAEAIARIGQRQKTEVLHLLVSVFEDQDETKRMRVVWVLSQMNGEEIEIQLLKAFKDSSSRVRCEALRALAGRLTEAVISGVTLALTDESAEVRRLAVGALGRYPQPRALPALRLAAEDSDFWVRVAVMRALENFAGAEVQPLLLRGVADPVGAVAIAALETSVQLCPTASQGLLEDALNHSDEEVVKVAMHQLAQLNGVDWIAPFVGQLLNHRHWDVRLQAVRSLCRSGLSQAQQLLENRFKVEGEALVRQALETALLDRVQDLRREL